MAAMIFVGPAANVLDSNLPGHLITALILAVTIGIPFAWAYVKLAGLALWPIGKIIIPAEDRPLRYGDRGRG